jgi:TolB-like protein
MKKPLIALLTATLLSQPAAAIFLTSEGKAPIRHNDRSTARYLATLDAMNQASLENGAQVTSDTIMNNLSVRSDTFRIRTQGKVGKVHMLHEWEEDGIYYVRISADVSDSRLNCGSPDALVHNKRIGITQFTNQALHDSSDLRGVEQGLSQMLVRQINQTPALRAVNLSDYALSADSYAERQEQVQQLARQSGVQFIVAGTLQQAGREAIGDLAESGPMKEISSLIGMVQQQVQNRYLEIGTTLYDGESGELIAQQHEGTTVLGRTHVGRETPVGSHRFLSSTTGSGFQQLISAQARRLAEELSCQPMITSIGSIQGNTITLPVGSNAGIHPGDRLVIVERNNPLNILGTLQITQVSTTHASGMTDVEASVLGIQTTDLVRSW